jgi:hypothetical protein
LTTQYKGLRNQNTAFRMDVNNVILKEVEKFLFLFNGTKFRQKIDGGLHRTLQLFDSILLNYKRNITEHRDIERLCKMA